MSKLVELFSTVTPDSAVFSANLPTQKIKNIILRSDGRWQGSKTIKGQRVFVYAQTQKECLQKLNKAKPKPKKPTQSKVFVDFALWWVRIYKADNISESTSENYRRTIRKHLNIKTKLSDLTTLELQTVLNNLPATRTRENCYKIIRQIIKKAYELEYVKKDISQFLVLGKIEKSSRTALGLDDQRTLVNSLSDDIFSLRVLVFLCTGMRPNEFKTIRKNEIEQNYLKVHGTKSINAERWIKISSKLQNLILEQDEKFFNFDLKRFRQRFQKHCAQIGIEEIDIYKLRHTFATNLYILRIPEKDRQTYLGHAKGSDITNQVYTTFSPNATAQNIKDIYKEYYPEF